MTIMYINKHLILSTKPFSEKSNFMGVYFIFPTRFLTIGFVKV